MSAIVKLLLAVGALLSGLRACWAGLCAGFGLGRRLPAQLLRARQAPLQPPLGPRKVAAVPPCTDQAGWPLRELEALLAVPAPGESGARLLMAEFVSAEAEKVTLG